MHGVFRIFLEGFPERRVGKAMQEAVQSQPTRTSFQVENVFHRYEIRDRPRFSELVGEENVVCP
ncbi:hypothetical protein D3C83_133390 [compost metagenome]